MNYEYLEKVWDNNDAWKSESSYYTKEEHKLIDNFILGYKKTKKNTQTETTKEQKTNDELEMKTIEEEINTNTNTNTKTEQTMTKPDT